MVKLSIVWEQSCVEQLCCDGQAVRSLVPCVDGVNRWLTQVTAAQALPNLRSVALRFDAAKSATLKLPFGVHLSASCAISVVGGLSLLTVDTTSGELSAPAAARRGVTAACAAAAADALLACGAASLSLELSWNVSIYCELRGIVGAERESTTAHQLAASLRECGLEDGSPVRVSSTAAVNGLRLVIERR